jgi:uncharacterized protein YukE
VSSASARSGSKAAATGKTGTRSIPLDLKPALAHLRPDPQSSIRIEGVPAGMRLSAGAGDGGGWTLALAELDGLAVVAPADFKDQSPLSISLLRPGAQGANAEVVSSFGILLTADGAMSAFSGLEVEERDCDVDSVVRLRASVGKGRGQLKVKSAKRPLDFGNGESTAAFIAQRSSAHLEALFRGELAYNDGVTSEASLEVEQRIRLARTMWEGEAAQRLAEARRQWEAEQTQLNQRIGELETRLREAKDEIKRIHDEREDWHGNVRAKLIEVVQKLNDEHAAELAQIEQRLKREAEEMLATARVDWERKTGIATA